MTIKSALDGPVVERDRNSGDVCVLSEMGEGTEFTLVGVLGESKYERVVLTFTGLDILVVLEVTVSTNEVSWWYEKGRVTEVALTIIFSVLRVYTGRALMPSLSGDRNLVIVRDCEGRAVFPRLVDISGM